MVREVGENRVMGIVGICITYSSIILYIIHIPSQKDVKIKVHDHAYLLGGDEASEGTFSLSPS